MNLNSLDDENSNEPLTLADRLKLKGSPVDLIKGGGVKAEKEKKPRAPKEPKGSVRICWLKNGQR